MKPESRIMPEGIFRSIKVLMYHRITNDDDLYRSNWTCVHTRDFWEQMRLLSQWGFSAITFEDYRMFWEGKLELPRHPVIITFDDGYLDTYDLAYPVLQEFGLKAVVFVLGDQTIRTNYWDRHLGMGETRLMNKKEILEMHSMGHEIGAHSLTHAGLTKVPENRAWEEISRSKILLEKLLGKPVQSFCYPYGMVNPQIKSMVKRAGYTIACSVNSGPAAFGNDDFEIRRMTIFNTTGVVTFGMRMLTPFEYYDWTRWRIAQTLNEIRGVNHYAVSNKITQPHPIGLK